MDKLQERLYEIAASELAEKRPVPGLMAKAFSDADGDEKRSYARYIKLRVEQLVSESKELREQQKEGERRQKDEAERERRADLQRPKTISLICSKCGHNEAYIFPKGDWGVFFLLLTLFVVPGLIYALLRNGYKYVCTRCGHQVHPKHSE